MVEKSIRYVSLFYIQKFKKIQINPGKSREIQSNPGKSRVIQGNLRISIDI
jgi:hypothetical protein